MKVFVVQCTLFLLAYAQECGSPQGVKEAFGAYLQCIKKNLDSDYSAFEQEISEHSRRAASTCFASTIADANRKGRCVLAPSDLDSKAWDRNGPLRDCSICRTFAAGAIKAVLNTPAEDQRCIRVEVTKAIAREADHCLRKKIANFAGVPEIPDLEEKSFQFKESVTNSISDFILVRSRLAFCAERKPDRAQATRNCLQNPFVGYLQQHCSALNKCDQQLSAACSPSIKAAKKATCACVDEAREELKRRILSIAEAVRQSLSGARGAPAIGSGSKVDSCVAGIRSQLITPVNDWVSVIDSALNMCIKNKPSGQSLGMESLLNVGCRKVIADTTGTAAAQLKVAFDFMNHLIDAMVERAGRFCGGAHCSNSS